jgi:hypothetical protein
MINTDHMVSINQRSKQPSIKTQILLANTSSSLNDYFTKISTRCNGSYDASFAFTISSFGDVYQHYNPLHFTNLFGIPEVDSQIISIGLENVGWLTAKEGSDDFFDWKHSIYKGEVHSKLWRGHRNWADYPPEQIQAMLRLIKELIKEYHIKPAFSGTNLPMEEAKGFQGVLNRSNYAKCYYDLSPAALPYFEHINNTINAIK